MRVTSNLISLLCFFSFSSFAVAGSNTPSEKDLRLLYRDAQKSAAESVAHIFSCSFASNFSVSAKAQAWILKNKDQLVEDILDTPHVWEQKPHPTCARTALQSKSVVTFSVETCQAGSIDPVTAERLIIHESVHHFGIADEAFADEVADAVVLADKVMGCKANQFGGKPLGSHEAVVYGNSGKYLATFNLKEGFRVWNAYTGQMVSHFSDPKNRSLHIGGLIRNTNGPSYSLSPNGKYLVAILRNYKRDFKQTFQMVTWDVKTGKVILDYEYLKYKSGGNDAWRWSEDDRYFSHGASSSEMRKKIESAGCIFDLEKKTRHCPAMEPEYQGTWHGGTFLASENSIVFNQCGKSIGFLRMDLVTGTFMEFPLRTMLEGCYQNNIKVFMDGKHYLHQYHHNLSTTPIPDKSIRIYSLEDNRLLHEYPLPLGTNISPVIGYTPHSKSVLLWERDRRANGNYVSLWIPGVNDSEPDRFYLPKRMWLRYPMANQTISQSGHRVAYEDEEFLVVRDSLVGKEILRLKMKLPIKQFRFIDDKFISFVDQSFVLKTVKLPK